MLLDTYEYDKNSYHPALDAQKQGLIRLLGWTGICCQTPTYSSLAVDLLLKNQMYTEDIPISTLSTKISNQQMKEIQFLRNPIDIRDNPLQLMYFHNIFSIYESIFPKR